MRAGTRAAEGLDRRAFSVSEIPRMQDAGIIADDENFELIQGELVPFQARSHVHELLKSALNYALVPAMNVHFWLSVERGPDDVLTHPALPGFSIRLSDY